MKNQMIYQTTQPELRAIIEQILNDLLASKSEASIPADSILTIEEAAKYLQIPKGTIYQLTHRREIPFNKVGRNLRFRLSDLDSWLSSNRKSTRNELLNKLNPTQK